MRGGGGSGTDITLLGMGITIPFPDGLARA